MNRIKNVLTSTNLITRITRIFVFLICIFGFLALSAVEGWFLIPKAALAADSDLIINEIMYDYPGSDEDREWVEVKNTGATPITIGNDWRFWDGANHTFNLYQGSNIIESGGFAVLADDPATFLADHSGFSGAVFKVTMSLNNEGDTLKLSKDDGATYFSEISYFKNLGAAGDGKTLEREPTIGVPNSDSWQGSFVTGGTPGRGNSAPADRPQYSRNVYINEILPYPSAGSDNEFIELYNSGGSAVDLSGWKLDDVIGGGASAYQIEQGITIAPAGYLVFYKSKTGIALNDDGDYARLIDPNGEEVSSIPYPAAKKAESYIRLPEGFWRWTIEPTPLSENILKPPSSAGFATSFADLQVIPVKTGEVSNFQGRKVEIAGEVAETSGDTFYLDDGTGRIKCYIQAKTGIDKPKMYKGDKVRVAGVVNLYRGVWRVLPQNQEDVEIIGQNSKIKIQKSKAENKVSEAKSTNETITSVDQSYPSSEAQSLLKEITDKQGQVKGAASSNLLNKIVLWVVIMAGFLLILLVGEYLWKRRLQPNQLRRQKNPPGNSPKDFEADKW